MLVIALVEATVLLDERLAKALEIFHGYISNRTPTSLELNNPLLRTAAVTSNKDINCM